MFEYAHNITLSFLVGSVILYIQQDINYTPLDLIFDELYKENKSKNSNVYNYFDNVIEQGCAESTFLMNKKCIKNWDLEKRNDKCLKDVYSDLKQSLNIINSWEGYYNLPSEDIEIIKCRISKLMFCN